MSSLIMVLQMLGKGSRIVGNQRTNRDYRNCGMIKIDQNTEKSPRDLRYLHSLTLKGKTICLPWCEKPPSKIIIMIIIMTFLMRTTGGFFKNGLDNKKTHDDA